MKHKIFRLFLKLLKRLVLIKQVGNPYGSAPTPVPEPDEQEIFSQPFPNTDIFIWQLRKNFCSGLYGGAVINKCNQVYERFLSFPWGKQLHPALFSPYLGRQIANIDKAILLITPVPSSNYYHWMVDVLPRLILAKDLGLKDFDQRKIILHKKEKAYEIEALQLLGIPVSNIIRLSPFETVSVEDMIVPDFYLSFSEKPFPWWKKKLIDEFKQVVIAAEEPKTLKKIYCLRGKQKTRQLIGEEHLISILKEKGFVILDPAKMTLKEQIGSLAGAEVVIALHGAALTNIIFCAKGTRIIELRSTHYPQEYFSGIAKTYDLLFETVSIPPHRKRESQNLANEENLFLTEESINILLDKIADKALKQ